MVHELSRTVTITYEILWDKAITKVLKGYDVYGHILENINA